MRSRLFLLAAVGVLAVFALAGPGTGQQPAEQRPAKVTEFGDTVLYIVSRPKDAKSESVYGLVEKVKVVTLGDRAFLVGAVPDYGEGDEASKVAAGKKVWTPVDDVVQMTEFKTVDEAKKYFDAGQKKDGDQSSNRAGR